MALEGTANTPFGPVKKQTLLFAGVGLAGVAGIAWYRSKKQASAATADNAGVDTSQIDPNTGVPYSQEGIDPTTGMPYAASGSGAYAYPPLSGSGYDYSGYAGYSGIPGSGYPQGPGSFTSNAQWAQYVEQYMVDNTGADAATVGNAVGKYITGQPVSSDQKAVIQQAIAFGGFPPVPGPAGAPPSIVDSPTVPPPPATKVKVPNIVGMQLESAYNVLARAGLSFHDAGKVPQTTIRTVTAQNPKAGVSVVKGTKVSITYKTTHKR